MSTDRPIQFSRREALGLFGGALLLAACGTKSGSSAGTKSGSSAGTKTNTAMIPLRLTGELYKSSDPQRFAFGLWKNGKAASGPMAEIGFKGPGGAVVWPKAATLHADGLPENRGVYVTYPVLDVAGQWTAVVHVGNETMEMPFPVAKDATTPKVGAAAPRAASPTYVDHLGVDPICTQDPPCPLHAQSLSSVIGTGAKVAVLFATPARCQSQYCGPVLDELLSVRKEFPDITFVHVEIYENNQSAQTAPTVQAWGLQTEPWLFTVKGDGTVLGRLDGAMDRSEMRAELTKLASSS